MSSATVVAAEQDLRSWIREHKVCWEITPHFETREHAKTLLGFDLTLLARGGGRGPADPGDPESSHVYERLRKIAESVLPKGVRYAVEPFDASFRLRRESGWEPEVELVVEVLHREGTFEPLDESERRYAADVEERLERLGVQPQAWRAPRRA